MEAAAVSLHHHHHGALPPLNHHHRSSLPVPIPPQTTTTTTTTRRPCVVCSSSSSKPLPLLAACLTLPNSQAQRSTQAAHHSSRAATGYAAALADACVRAGTLRRACRDARALLLSSSSHQVEEEQKLDARVAALVRLLVGKGKPGMVAEVMAEFGAICDKLLPRAAQYYRV